MIARGRPEHPAVEAWRKLQPASAGPESIHVLRERMSSATYRLIGVVPGGSTVIAKRCRAAWASVERRVYAEVLPHLPVTSPRYYGSVEGADGRCWLFLEDVGDERYVTSDEEQCALAGRWLGRMHTSTTMRADAAAAARVCRTEDRIVIYSTSARHARTSCATSPIPPSPPKTSLC